MFSPWPGGEVLFLCGCILPVCFFPFRVRTVPLDGSAGEWVFQPNVMVLVWLLSGYHAVGSVFSQREAGPFRGRDCSSGVLPSFL